MTCWALVVPMGWSGKAMLGGKKDKGEVCAVPERGTNCGLPLALSATESEAFRVPVLVGLKITAMVQVAPALTCVPQLLVCEKSCGFAPVIEIRERVRAAFPVFVSVTFCG